MARQYFVYILANTRRGVLYVGMSSQLIQRIEQHRAKAVAGFTASYGVTRLVYYECHDSAAAAKARENSLKRWRREWKFKLIEGLNPNWDDLAEQLML